MPIITQPTIEELGHPQMGGLFRNNRTVNRIVNRTPGIIPPGSSLLTDLYAYWKLDETSGTRVDSTANAQDLTSNNNVTSNPGIILNGAQITAASSNFLSHPDSNVLSTGDIDFTICTWVNINVLGFGSNRPIMQKGWDDAYGEYVLYYSDGIAKPVLFIANGAASVSNNSTSLFTPDTWYFIVAGYDATNDQLFISTNNGTVDTASYAGGNTQTTGNFKIGTAFGAFMQGVIDETGFWKRLLTPTEITTLYNAGAGLSYPF